MTEVTADTIALRIVVETEQAQRNIQAYGANVQRTMATVEVSTARASAAAATAATRQSEAYRQLGRQLSGAAADALAGKNAFDILARHGTEVASSFIGFGGTVGRVASFLSGPWGVAINIAAAAAGKLTTHLLDNEGAATRAAEGAAALANRQSDIGKFIDHTTGRIVEQNQALIDNAILTRQRQIEAKGKEVDAHRQTAVVAIRRAASLEPTSSDIYNAAFGDVPTLRLDRELLDTLRVGRDDFEGLDQHIKALAARRPDLRQLRETVSDAVSKAIVARREFIEPRETDIKALQGDKAAQQAVARRLAQPGPVALPASVATSFENRTFVSPQALPPTTTFDQPALDLAVAVRAGNEALTALASLDTSILHASSKADADGLEARLKTRDAVATDQFGQRMGEVTKAIEAARGASETLARDLSTGLTQAILKGESLGKVLENAFLKAGAAAIQSRIFDFLTTGEVGGLFKSIGSFVAGPAGAKAPGRASGGHVSAGQLYRVNEMGVEGFRPAGSGTIVPLGRMAAHPRGGGVTVVQPLNVSFAGAITTPELMAQFKAYADSVGQAAAIGGAAMAQARIARRAARALPR